MIFFWSITGYAVISVVLYFVCRAKCRKRPVFRAPERRAVYYLLSLTWGLPTVLIGGIIAAFVRLAGHRAERYGWEWCFEIPGLRYGLELGLFFIAPAGNSENTKMHEHGHGIQNIYLGIFYPTVILIPSAARFWYREIRQKLGRPCGTDYPDIWFEGSAGESGRVLMERLARSDASQGRLL